MSIPLLKLDKIVQRVRHSLKALFADYPLLNKPMKAYLVLALRGEQSELSSNSVSRLTLLKEVPSLFIYSPDYRKVQQKVRSADRRLKTLDKRKKMERGERTETRTLIETERDELIRELAPNLRLRDEGCIELRFKQLHFEVLKALKHDVRVDQTLTPQGPTSIRIVFGTLGGLLGQPVDKSKTVGTTRSYLEQRSGRKKRRLGRPAHRVRRRVTTSSGRRNTSKTRRRKPGRPRRPSA